MKTVTSCGVLVECSDKILILHRVKDDTEGGTWGLPAGKIHEGESELECAKREVVEETGYSGEISNIEHVHTFDWDFGSVRVVFPTFRLRVSEEYVAVLNNTEHMDYAWKTPEEVYAMDNLIHGFKDLLETIYGCSS